MSGFNTIATNKRWPGKRRAQHRKYPARGEPRFSRGGGAVSVMIDAFVELTKAPSDTVH